MILLFFYSFNKAITTWLDIDIAMSLFVSNHVNTTALYLFLHKIKEYEFGLYQHIAALCGIKHNNEFDFIVNIIIEFSLTSRYFMHAFEELLYSEDFITTNSFAYNGDIIKSNIFDKCYSIVNSNKKEYNINQLCYEWGIENMTKNTIYCMIRNNPIFSGNDFVLNSTSVIDCDIIFMNVDEFKEPYILELIVKIRNPIFATSIYKTTKVKLIYRGWGCLALALKLDLVPINGKLFDLEDEASNNNNVVNGNINKNIWNREQMVMNLNNYYNNRSSVNYYTNKNITGKCLCNSGV